MNWRLPRWLRRGSMKSTRDGKREQIVASYATALNTQEGLDTLLARDVVWHISGMSRLAGEYVGRDAVSGYFHDLHVLSEGTFRANVELETLQPRARHEIALVQHISVVSQGREVRNAEAVMLKVKRGGKIYEGRTTPVAGDAQTLWGGAAPVLTPADAAILSGAIRRGQAERPPSPLNVAATFLAAAVFALSLAFVYQLLQNSRPATGLTLSNGQLGDQGAVTLGNGAPVQWQIRSAYVRGVEVLAFGNGEVTINTPIPTRRCEDIARALHSRTTCRRGALSVDAPLYTSWVHAAFTTALDGSGSYVTQGVDISERATAPGLDVTFVVRPGSSPVAWCLATPLTPNTLTISRGGTERYTQSFSGDDGVDCHAGVRLVVASHGIASVPPVVLQGTDSLDMKAVSRSAEVRGMTAQYKLDPGGRHGVDRTSDVRFVGPVETDLLIQGSRASLQMKSGSVSSAVTDNDEAVPSLWTSHQWWLAPLFITILTALVVAPLLAVVDSAVKWLKSKH